MYAPRCVDRLAHVIYRCRVAHAAAPVIGRPGVLYAERMERIMPKYKELPERIDKIYFQYFYDEKRQPRITVCYLDVYESGENITAIGIALCSMRDQPNKKIGRHIALGRAKKAWFSFNKACVVQREYAWHVMGACDIDSYPAWKSLIVRTDKTRPSFRYKRLQQVDWTKIQEGK